MTEYEQLKAAHKADCKRQDAYVWEGRQFAAEITAAFRAHLGCNEVHTVTAHKPKTEIAPRTAVNPRSAVSLEDNSFFHLTIALWLGSEFDSLSFPVIFKKLDGMWQVGLERVPEITSVKPGTNDGLEVVFRNLVALAKDQMEHGFEQFLAGKPKQSPLGFTLHREAEEEGADRAAVTEA